MSGISGRSLPASLFKYIIPSGQGRPSGRRLSLPLSARGFQLFALLVLLAAFVSGAHAAPSMVITAPAAVDVCGTGSYKISLQGISGCGSGLSVTATMPAGFSYIHGAKVTFPSSSTFLEPATSGHDITWDLGNAYKHLMINEFQQSPDDSGKEWIELYNPEAQEVSLKDWTLVEHKPTSPTTKALGALPQDASIPAGGYYVVYYASGNLVDTAMNLSLVDSSGAEVDRTPSKAKVTGKSWARYPNGQDTDLDSDWQSRSSSRGGTNGGQQSNFPFPDSAEINFSLITDCSAYYGQKISALSTYVGGSVPATSSAIALNRADLKLTMSPDVSTVGLGFYVSWTTTVENVGNGSAYNVQVSDLLGSGLSLGAGQDLSWSYAEIGAGNSETRRITTQVISSGGLTNQATATWGCSAPCQQAQSTSSLAYSSSAVPGMNLTFSAPFEVEAEVPSSFSITATGTFLDPPSLTSLDVVIPDGFSLNGSSKVTIQGLSKTLNPQAQGNQLSWDLSSVHKSHLLINEFEHNPPHVDRGNEWVELYNPTQTSVTIDNYYLVERLARGTIAYFKIPAGTTIPARGYYFTTWDNGELTNSESFNLSLLYPNGTEIDTTIRTKIEPNDDSTGMCWARSPNGLDTDSDSDWQFQRSTPGMSNGGSIAYSMKADFNLTAEENATSGQTASATLTYSGSTATATSSPIAVKEPQGISLKLYPDAANIALGDPVSWTAVIENTGKGPIENVSAKVTLGKGLKFIPSVSGEDLNWDYPVIEVGNSETIEIDSQVISLTGLFAYLNVSATCAGHLRQENASADVECDSYMEPGLDLSAPEDVDINEIYNCSLGISGIVYDPEDTLLANIDIPEGFYYSGKARVFFQGTATPLEPEEDGSSLSCDLSPAVQLQSSKSIVINEILPYPSDGEEMIELYNAGSRSEDVSGWHLKDEVGHIISQIPASTCMAPGSFLEINATNLNNDEDTVKLFNGPPDNGIEVHSVKYNGTKKGMSYACHPDGSENWTWNTPSPGSSNGGSQLSIDFCIMAGPKATSGQSLNAEVSFDGISYRQSREIGVNALPVVSGNMSLSLTSPSSVYYSEPKQCSLNIKDEGARSRNIIASVVAPAGFSLSGNSTIALSGQSLVKNPEVSGGRLVWNLNSMLGSGRHVVINKFEQSPQGDGDRWVELYNPSSSDVDLSGWWLTSICNGQEKRMLAFSGVIIQSGGYYVATCDKADLPGTYPTNVTLYDSQGRVIDSTPSKVDEEHDDRCWARYPNGIGSWQFIPASPGESNGGACGDLYPDGTATIKFNLTAGCGSVSGQNISASVSHSDGSLSTVPKPISISYGTLTVNQTTDVDYVENGDRARWTVYIENRGSVAVHDIDVGDAPGRGIILRSITSPNNGLNWSYETIKPGQNETFEVEAVVNATSYLYNLVDVHWGCGAKHTSKKTYVKFKRIITKTPGTDKKYTLGQQASYLLTATLPKEDLSSLLINNTFPVGITYDPASLNITGASLLGESRALSGGDPDETTVEWRLGNVLPSAKVKVSFNATLDNSASNQDGTVIEDCNASVSFADEDGKVTTDSDFGGSITIVEPDLSISESSSTPKGQPKGNQTCTLIISHSPDSHAAAYDVDVKDVLPSSMSYVPGSIEILSGPQGSADDSDARVLRWHFDEIALSKAKSKRVQLRYNVTSGDSMGTMTDNATVTWSSMPGACPGERDGSGGVNDYLNSTTYQVDLPRLTISTTGSPDPVYAGDRVLYTIAYQNLGPSPAKNVVIRDELDPYAVFVSSDLAPSDANNDTWKPSCGIPNPLLPGEVHYINITALVNESLTNGTKLRNRFTISSDESAPRSGVIYTGVLAKSAIKVSKVALQKEVRRGEDVSYVIKVCNRGGLPAYNVTIKDLFDSRVDLVSISPAPGPDGTWHIGVMNPGECFSISLTVCIPRTDIAFSMDQGVSGQGFVNVAQYYSTTIEPYILTNYVTVSSDGNALVSNSAKVRVLGEPGTSLKSREHGSGSYSSAMTVRYLSKNKSIQMNEDMAAAYMPVKLDTPGARPLGFSSEWSRSIYARNEAIGSSITESYRNSKSLDCLSHLNLDENSSTASISSTFQGAAHIGYLKRPEIKSKPVFESTEDYDGRFKIAESTDDYGSGLAYDRSSIGQGFVNINRDIHDRQNVFESGMGDYLADEKIRAFTSYIEKNLTVTRGPAQTQHHSGPPLAWRSGIWSRNGDKTLLGEEFSDINRLEVKTVAQGLISLETQANFSGRERFKAVKKGDIEIDQEYVGDYTLARRVLLSGASRYSYPHITVFKTGRIQTVRDCTVAMYRICLLNDGNRVLGPVYLRDRFPAGTQFINASLRPSELTPDHANWTLTHLPIGGSSIIDLSLNVTRENDMLLNIVEASGGYDDMLVTAYNLSALEFNWLSCCPPRFIAHKNATQDPDRPQTVDYSLYLRNMANTTVVALVTDSPPIGQEVLSASVMPENVSGKMVWMLMDIAPGEEKVINYDASAPYEGSFSSTAHFEVYALDGSGMGTEDESANIVLPTGLKDGGSSGCGTSCPRNDTEASCPCTDVEQSQSTQGDSDSLPDEV